jgi:hypothetical protein
MKTLYIIRGLPGSGKTTLAQRITPYYFEADQHFTTPQGVYAFNPNLLPAAHAVCQQRVWEAMQKEFAVIAVSNTFSQRWEVEPYRVLARLMDYAVVELTMNNTFANIHGVPAEAIQKMKERWEP